MTQKVAVVIPTRNRPEKLRRCLAALAQARQHIDFHTYACDSSNTEETRLTVQAICNEFEHVSLHFHQGKNAAAARNFCVQVADADLLITVDDDVYVAPETIKRLVDTYHATSNQGLRIVAGSVAWGEDWSQPVVMRPIGYGRNAQSEEQPSFVVSALLLYPRELALALPWNERIRTSEDRFMGAVWNCRSVKMVFDSEARAFHDHEHNYYDVKEQAWHIYANLFDAVLANPNPVRALAYEFLGFLAGAKLYFRRLDTAITYVKAWIYGHQALIKDWSFLQNYKCLPLPSAKSQEAIAPVVNPAIYPQLQ